MTSRGKKENKPSAENTTANNTQDEITSESNTIPESNNEINNMPTSSADETTTANSDDKKKDASLLSESEIIEMYKNATSKSDSNIKSVQNISLNDIKINDGSGIANNMIKMVKPIISRVISGNSAEFDDIAGGYIQYPLMMCKKQLLLHRVILLLLSSA